LVAINANCCFEGETRTPSFFYFASFKKSPNSENKIWTINESNHKATHSQNFKTFEFATKNPEKLPNHHNFD
jgi:hypothetical protein